MKGGQIIKRIINAICNTPIKTSAGPWIKSLEEQTNINVKPPSGNFHRWNSYQSTIITLI